MTKVNHKPDTYKRLYPQENIYLILTRDYSNHIIDIIMNIYLFIIFE